MPRRTWHTCQPTDLFKLARSRFLRESRIELQKLSRELGISRATAYRWAGNSEHLIGVVLASLADDTFRRVAREARGEGANRILEVMVRVMRYAQSFLPLQTFLEHDPQMGLRILASDQGPVRDRSVCHLKEIIEQEEARDHFQLTIDSDELARLLTRVMETHLYTDLITDVAPDIDGAQRMAEILLRQTTFELDH